ncbi:MAG: hypothetical protein ACUVUF_00715 [Candidatus Bathycorpusculaceae bacterium]
MTFPLDFWNISLLTAITAIILLITSELLSPYYGKINIKLNKKRLKNVALAFSIIFLTTVVIRIVNILLT